MNLQQLIYFEKVAEMEHYTRAAEELHITQPCMSHAISELEKELGVPLFYKKGRNIKLTRFGMNFHEHVRKSLEELQAGIDEIREQNGVQAGHVYIAHISSMYMRYIPFLMTQFFQDPMSSGIKLEMHEAPTLEIVRELKERKLDVGFGGYVDDDELQFDKIYDEHLTVIVGNNHPLAGRNSITLKETEGYDMIAYDPVCSIRQVTDELYRKAGVKRNIVGEYFDNHMIVGMVANSQAIAVVPETFGTDRSNIQKLNILDPGAQRSLYMISMKDDYHTPVVDRFMDFIKGLSLNK